MAVLLASVPAFSHVRPSLPGRVNVEIVSDGGSIFQDIPHQDLWNGGTNIVKKYLEARKGENYGIVIKNNTPERIGIVIAVDGRNIISGKRSDLKSGETMYIVNAYEQARYDGWRTSNDEVHRFYFTNPSDSYSIRTFNDSSAMGVIAVAVFREQERPQPLYTQRDRKQGEAAPAAPSAGNSGRSMEKALADESAGTGFGDSRYSPVIKVEFEPERMPIQKTLIKYEWRETLCRKGILRCGYETGNRLWDAGEYAPFPPERGVNR
jgi:hypothetical protein